MKLICEHQPGWLDALEREVASLNAQRNLTMFALIDCAFNARCHAEIQRHGLPSRSLYDLSPTPSSSLQAVSPTLVPLTAATASSWREILRLTDGFPMLSLITTPETLDEIACRLEPWCIVNADGQPFVFRFPDTRRLPAVIDVLSPDQHGALFGPAVTWRYRTRAAQWADLPLPKISGAIAETVELDANQCAHLIRDSEADRLIENLALFNPGLLHSYTPATAHDLIETSLHRADYYGIQDSDREHWCNMLVQQPRLEEHPASAALLAALHAKKHNYTDIRNELDRLARVS